MKVKTIIERAGGLSSAADLARDWGITRQRLTVLQRAKGFPEPVATVNDRPVWLSTEAREWRDKQTQRKEDMNAKKIACEDVKPGERVARVANGPWANAGAVKITAKRTRIEREGGGTMQLAPRTAVWVLR